MRLRRFSAFGALAMMLMVSASVNAQGDASAGNAKNAACEGCHGIEGFRTAYPTVYSVPMLGGQSEAYLVAALKAYRAGDRNHPTMRAIAASLSDQDIADLAAYYAASGE